MTSITITADPFYNGNYVFSSSGVDNLIETVTQTTTQTGTKVAEHSKGFLKNTTTFFGGAWATELGQRANSQYADMLGIAGKINPKTGKQMAPSKFLWKPKDVWGMVKNFEWKDNYRDIVARQAKEAAKAAAEKATRDTATKAATTTLTNVAAGSSKFTTLKTTMKAAKESLVKSGVTDPKTLKEMTKTATTSAVKSQGFFGKLFSKAGTLLSKIPGAKAISGVFKKSFGPILMVAFELPQIIKGYQAGGLLEAGKVALKSAASLAAFVVAPMITAALGIAIPGAGLIAGIALSMAISSVMDKALGENLADVQEEQQQAAAQQQEQLKQISVDTRAQDMAFMNSIQSYIDNADKFQNELNNNHYLRTVA